MGTKKGNRMKLDQKFEIAKRINTQLDEAIDVDQVVLTHSRRLKILIHRYKEEGILINPNELLEVTHDICNDSIALGEIHMKLYTLLVEVIELLRKEPE